MKHTRPSKSHGKRKAPRGAYSDRYGPRLVGSPREQADPWLKDFPIVGLPAVTILPNGTVIRRP